MSTDSERIAHLKQIHKHIEAKQRETRDGAEDADLGRQAVKVAAEIRRIGGTP